MLKIEFEPYEVEPGQKPEDYVIVNEEADYHSSCFDIYGKKIIIIRNEVVFNELLKYTFQDVGGFIAEFGFRFEKEEYPFNMRFYCIDQPDNKAGAVIINFELDIEEWRNPFTIREFANALNETIRIGNFESVRYRQEDEFITNDLGLEWVFNQSEVNIGIMYDRISSDYKKIIEQSKLFLLSQLDQSALLSYFNFPEEIKVPCIQYLVYFAQFLSDLGIQAEVEVTPEEYGSTLFKVLPNDKDTSLMMIKEALDEYLNASGRQFLNEFPRGNIDVAVMQLQANVMHLQSQLMLAKSSLQMKDAAIQSLELTNYQYKQIFEEKGAHENEDVIPGLVSVSKLESNGVSINLAELLKRLKRLLK